MRFEQKLLAAAAAFACAASAQAVTVTGDTTGGPTFNRALQGTPPTGLSLVGTAVSYTTLNFTVSASGSYTFLSDSTAATTGGTTWDNFAFLYQGSFNPAAALTNVLIGNDDNPTIGLAGFSFALTAGTNYVFVTTGFANTDFGPYSLSITGPGNVVIGNVPEPGAWAMMLGGLAGVAALARRRRGNVRPCGPGA